VTLTLTFDLSTPQAMSLLVHPKVIPYTELEHFGIIRFWLCCGQSNKQTDGLKSHTHADQQSRRGWWVFKARRNESRFEAEVKVDGRLFHALAADLGNAQLPSDTHCIMLICYAMSLDRSVLRERLNDVRLLKSITVHMIFSFSVLSHRFRMPISLYFLFSVWHNRLSWLPLNVHSVTSTSSVMGECSFSLSSLVACWC